MRLIEQFSHEIIQKANKATTQNANKAKNQEETEATDQQEDRESSQFYQPLSTKKLKLKLQELGSRQSHEVDHKNEIVTTQANHMESDLSALGKHEEPEEL